MKHSEPLPVGDSEVFYDIDTFDEDVLLKQQQEGSGEQDVEMKGPESEDTSMEVEQKVEEPVKPVKEKKKKEKKEVAKKEEVKVVEEEKETKSDDTKEEIKEETEEANKSEESATKKMSKKEKAALKLEQFKTRQAEIKAAKTALKAQEDEGKKPYDPMEGVDPSKCFMLNMVK